MLLLYGEALQAVERAAALDPAQPRVSRAQVTVFAYPGREADARQAQARCQSLMGGSDQSGSSDKTGQP